MIPFRFSYRKDPSWLDSVLSSLKENGFAILEDVLDREFISTLKDASEEAREDLSDSVGEAVLLERGEYPYVRLPMNFNPVFYDVLGIDPMLSVLDSFFKTNFILRNQICQRVYPNKENDPAKRVFHFYHQNFRHLHFIPGVIVDCVIPLDDSTEFNGVLLAFPQSHRWSDYPTEEELSQRSCDLVKLIAPAGSLIFLDGMTWHREDHNRTDQAIDFVLHQFSPPIFKQHFDYPRAIDSSIAETLPDRIRTVLGFDFRVPDSIESYFRAEGDILYRDRVKLPN